MGFLPNTLPTTFVVWGGQLGRKTNTGTKPIRFLFVCFFSHWLPVFKLLTTFFGHHFRHTYLHLEMDMAGTFHSLWPAQHQRGYSAWLQQIVKMQQGIQKLYQLQHRDSLAADTSEWQSTSRYWWSPFFHRRGLCSYGYLSKKGIKQLE